MFSQLTVDDAHEQLAGFFQGLQEGRTQPIYLLEYQGSGVNTDAMLGCTRRELATRPCSDLGWRRHYLPLLVLAADHGYTYRGPSTKFWEGFESRLGTRFDFHARRTLTELHKLAARDIQLAEPPDTPWARQFCHIAWPITHAVLPMDLQLALTSCLAQSQVPISPDSDPSSVMTALRSAAWRNTGVRFRRWLESPAIVHAVVLGLLQRPEESWLHPALLARMQKDIASDHAALLQLKVARRKHEFTRSTAHRTRRETPVETVHGELNLSSHTMDGTQTLGVRFPALSTDDAKRVRTCGLRASLWGQSRTYRLDSLFSGQVVPFSLETWPVDNQPLSEAAGEHIHDNPLIDRLTQAEIDMQLPLVFQPPWSAMPDVGLMSPDSAVFWPQVHGRVIDESKPAYVLTEHAPPTELSGLKLASQLSGIHCLEVTETDAPARSWLEDLGISVASGPGIEWVGAPQIHGFPDPVYYPDDPLMARIHGAGILGHKAAGAEMKVGDGDLVQFATSESFLALQLDSGSDLIQDKVLLDAKTPRHAAHAEPLGPLTIHALRSGALSMRLHGQMPLEDLLVRVTLEVAGSPIAWSDEHRAALPTIIGGRQWLKMVEASQLAQLYDLEELVLRVEIPGLWGCIWHLAASELDYTWKLDGGSPIASNESGELSLIRSASNDPIHFHESGETEEESITLFLPLEKETLQGGLCTGPKTLSVSWTPPEPHRLVRTSQGKGDTTGLMDVLQAYFRWSTATSSNPAVEFRRRQVIKTLEAWAVQTTCGPGWLHEERESTSSGSMDAWDALVQVCSRALEQGEPIGFDTWIHEQEEISAEEFVALQSFASARLHTAFPDLPTRLWLGGLPDESSVRKLNEVFNLAYADLRDYLTHTNPESLEGRELGADGCVNATTWGEAFATAAEDFEMHGLLSMLWPRGQTRELANYDYDGVDLGDLAMSISDWIARNKDGLLRMNWTPADVHLALLIWNAPALALQSDWQPTAACLLEDRGASRVFRYVSLRYQAATCSQREGGQADA